MDPLDTSIDASLIAPGTAILCMGKERRAMNRKAGLARHPPDPPASCQYAIRVEGHLDVHWSEWLEGMTITGEEGDTTLLEGALRDQSALLGLLCKLGDLHLPILSLQRWEPPSGNG